MSIPEPVDPLTRALLPTLLHKLGNATQLLTGVNALLAIDGGDALLEERAQDLRRTGVDIERLGWLLGVLSSGCGADLLLARRAPEGLAWMLELLRDATRRAGCAIAAPEAPPPRLAADALDGWQVPWAAATLLHAAAADAEGRAELSWSLARTSGGAWRLAAAGGVHVAAAAERVAPQLPGASLALQSCGAFTLDLPGGWLRDEGG
jgi:hypothetical protein